MPPQTGGPLKGTQELEMLKSQAQDMGAQLQAINARISELEHSGPASTLIAVVNAEECTACGICQQVCPTDAISLDDIAQIDREKCTGCGQCVAECPQDALLLKKA
jgi:ferredoxin